VKLYLETTVPNMLFAEDAPEKRRATEAFFRWLRITSDELYASRLVKDELDAAPDPKRSRMLQALADLHVVMLQVPTEAAALAEHYVREKALPAQYRNDALHVATAVCHRLDVVVSWNMKHLVNMRRVQRINKVNARVGWPAIRIHTPEEVLDL
jgi:hypothetical protein